MWIVEESHPSGGVLAVHSYTHLVLPKSHVEESHPSSGVLAVQLRALGVQALHDEVEGLQKGTGPE